MDDPETAHAFIRQALGRGEPVLVDHLDGGVIYGSEGDGDRTVWFHTEGPGRGPNKLADLECHSIAVVERVGDEWPPEKLFPASLEHAYALARPHTCRDAPAGLAAVENYQRDVGNPEIDFSDTDWLCWAAFERLHARHFCAVWLNRASDYLPAAAEQARGAAGWYQRAYEGYWAFARERDKMPVPSPAAARALDEAVAAEAAAVAALGRVAA